MKRLKLIAAFFYLMLTTSLIAQEEVPNLTVSTLDGTSQNLSDNIKDGTITLVTFWATWCKPCVLELNNFNELYSDWQSEFGLEIIAVTVDDSRNLPKVPNFVAGKSWEYTIVSANEREASTAFGFERIPQMYLIDQKGNIVWSHSGYTNGDEDDLEQHLSDLVKD